MSITSDLFYGYDEVPARTGDRPGGWGEVGTKSLEYIAEKKLPGGTELRVHAWLKRHADSVTIAWHVAASRDDGDDLDPSKTSISVSIRESGLLKDVDEAEIKAAFERVARRAATRCIARVAAAWGVSDPEEIARTLAAALMELTEYYAFEGCDGDNECECEIHQMWHRVNEALLAAIPALPKGTT